MTLIQFGDAEEPRFIPYNHAALYAADCDHPCPPGAAQRWPVANRRWITFHKDVNSSCMDFEPGTACFANPLFIPEWLNSRLDAHLTRPAFIYSDLANAEQAHHYAAMSRNMAWMWWVATLDDIQRSAAELAALLTHWGAPTVPGLVAAQQWAGRGTYDANHCFSGW